ncbi:hypothetical protein HY837_02215 [archaeon]|nr:hypothetical protein [archaeon]
MKQLIEGLEFSRQEKNALIITILVLAFIFSFNQWGPGEEANLGIGVKNFFVSVIIVGISVFFHHAGQKITAHINGFKAEHKIWWTGLSIGLLMAMVTNGALLVLTASGTFVEKTKKRLGYKRPTIDLYDYGRVAMWGPMSNIFLGATTLTTSWIFNIPEAWVGKMFTFNVLYAFYNLLPFPPLDGSKMFFASRLNYVFMMSAYSVYIAMIFLLKIYSFIWASVIAYFILLLYYYFVELNY